MPRLSKRAKKDLEGLPEALRSRADEFLARIDQEPALGKKLKGSLEGFRSARLGRAHRVIYRVETDGCFVVTIVPRKDAYR